MEEISGKDSFIFGVYPELGEAKKDERFHFFSLGDGYIGAGRISLDSADDEKAYGLLLAWSSDGKVIFRGGLDIYKRMAMLGQTTGSFQRAREHRGFQIGRKMAVAGLQVLKDFCETEKLSLNWIGLKTAPSSSMARIAEFLGMTDEEGKGFYKMNSSPDLNRLKEQLNIQES